MTSSCEIFRCSKRERGGAFGLRRAKLLLLQFAQGCIARMIACVCICIYVNLSIYMPECVHECGERVAPFCRQFMTSLHINFILFLQTLLLCKRCVGVFFFISTFLWVSLLLVDEPKKSIAKLSNFQLPSLNCKVFKFFCFNIFAASFIAAHRNGKFSLRQYLADKLFLACV